MIMGKTTQPMFTQGPPPLAAAAAEAVKSTKKRKQQKKTIKTVWKALAIRGSGRNVRKKGARNRPDRIR
jgi:hypothetical protein